ncbi:hypothetical protein [Mycetocola reblochoni]|uniref:Uncharacterized protein n=2 Tax=Mycetocola reblochoni TaxID=331618 RepID=A0A1R4JTC2_9MICO|nr:hypothetical protein [Mycetocola reblochoni]RLP70407.1 hypothetical protein D9V30_02545 [Mycetocola reblochoni]SJN35212.1 hypothetical protein FM119_09305 [Mycetocola reblochoni REB411]
MVTSSLAVGVSHDPPMVSASIQADSRTWPRLAAVGAIGVDVHPVGDHLLVVLRVLRLWSDPQRDAAVWHGRRLRSLGS